MLSPHHTVLISTALMNCRRTELFLMATAFDVTNLANFGKSLARAVPPGIAYIVKKFLTCVHPPRSCLKPN